jgi:hypothetical protein
MTGAIVPTAVILWQGKLCSRNLLDLASAFERGREDTNRVERKLAERTGKQLEHHHWGKAGHIRRWYHSLYCCNASNEEDQAKDSLWCKLRLRNTLAADMDTFIGSPELPGHLCGGHGAFHSRLQPTAHDPDVPANTGTIRSASSLPAELLEKQLQAFEGFQILLRAMYA